MNKKVVIWLIVIGVVLLLTIISYNPNKSPELIMGDDISKYSEELLQSFPAVSKIELFLFHATQRCPTCISIGRLSKATVEERFSEQLKSGKIEFREINIDLPENKILAEKFQARGSALFINSIKNGQDNIVEDTMVWQLAGGIDIDFKDYLSKKLNTILGI